jgi:branched-chain amino acid transport system ATP-binding protein
VPEGRQTVPALSVEENLRLGSVLRRARTDRARNLERVYTSFPKLAERRRQHAGTLSGGEQQMLAIGRALMANPLLMMFDEPSLGLSPLLTYHMFDIIATLHREGLSVVLVEQNVVESLALCQRAYVLENGAMTLEGSGDELLNDDRVRQAYLGL